MFTPASRSISATKCGVLPPPAVAQLMPPLCAFAQATNSLRLLAGHARIDDDHRRRDGDHADRDEIAVGVGMSCAEQAVRDHAGGADSHV